MQLKRSVQPQKVERKEFFQRMCLRRRYFRYVVACSFSVKLYLFLISNLFQLPNMELVD